VRAPAANGHAAATSSARASSIGGTSIPRAFVRLEIDGKFVFDRQLDRQLSDDGAAIALD